MKNDTKFIELKKVFKTLHGPKGCPWDRKQTHETLLPYLKEESDEFIAEVRRRDYTNMKEELGDILLQVMFHSEIASREGSFDIEDVIDTLIRKLKRRHPHVFGSTKVKSVRQVIINWNRIKSLEKRRKKRWMKKRI
ncbi:MAG: MazG nucleotide pyrophosphohydrolase domain-containing protein [Candidatus Omnitrophota bacterium]